MWRALVLTVGVLVLAAIIALSGPVAVNASQPTSKPTYSNVARSSTVDTNLVAGRGGPSCPPGMRETSRSTPNAAGDFWISGLGTTAGSR